MATGRAVLSPPVPTSIDRRPRTVSTTPAGVMGVKRSYWCCGVAGRGPEVVEGTGRAGAGVVVVVPERGPGSGEVPPPAGSVASLVGGERATGIGVVADGEHRPRDAVQQCGRGFVVAAGAASDVPRAYENEGSRGRRGARGDRAGRIGPIAVVLDASGHNSAGRCGEQPSSAQEHVPVIRVAGGEVESSPQQHK